MALGYARPRNDRFRPVLRPGRGLRPALTIDSEAGRTAAVLYLTAVLTVLALIYLGYVMIRPERF